MPRTLEIFAIIHPNPEHLEAARSAVLDIIEPTRLEDGCIKFDLLESEPKQYLFLSEEWTDEAALAEHFQMPYTQNALAAFQGLLAEPVVTHRLKALNVKAKPE